MYICIYHIYIYIWLGENAKGNILFNLRDTKLLYVAYIDKLRNSLESKLTALQIKLKIL